MTSLTVYHGRMPRRPHSVDSKTRRQFGVHYTSEVNIKKLIGPLFLDDLRAEFAGIKDSRDLLRDFHRKLCTLTFFDPACGRGDFLVVVLRELRLLEREVLGAIEPEARPESRVSVDQFFGIEIDADAARAVREALLLIHFAHRTFPWSSEVEGAAAVHCVIIGLGAQEVSHKTIYEYAKIGGEPRAIAASRINPYLVDADDVLISRRAKPLCDVPVLWEGVHALDTGILSSFTEDERRAFVAREPQARRWFRECLTGSDLIHGVKR